MPTVLARFEVPGIPELTVTLTREGEGFKISSLDGSPDSLFRSADGALAIRAFRTRVEQALIKFAF